MQVVSSPLLVTSPHKADVEGRGEEGEEDYGQEEEEEEEEERDSGTESVAEVKETVL